MLLSVVALSSLLYFLVRRNEQSEQDEDIQAYESMRKVKWHLEEEILEEAKKFFRNEELRSGSIQRKSSMKSCSVSLHEDDASAKKAGV
ncbi:hypothetical protein OESDEN_16362 [Oesophagostomum dentatum]|uniref:Uncharacterized protein n=1 Tax=Oesophagostomum dentatum TaxID=61180 RepID=A0A0B1SJ65_OESDE|nr:hypothetical protein OESDEN_16362 [Oesophagostomum dentatum]